MPSLINPRPGVGLSVIFAGLMAAVFSWGAWKFKPDPQQGRELALSMATQQALNPQPGAPRVIYAAVRLCRDITESALDQADCRLGRRMTDSFQGGGHSGGMTANNAAALLQGQAQLRGYVERYQQIRDLLHGVLQGSDRSWLLGGIELRLARISLVSQQSAPSYTELFEALLLADGLRYDSSSGQFMALRWDIARLLDGPDQVRQRAERLVWILGLLPLATGISVFLVVFIMMTAVGWWAGLLAVLFSAVSGLGLLIVADASLRFGVGSPVYLLNPFSYALERQGLIFALGLLLPVLAVVTAVFWGPKIDALFAWLGRRLGVVIFLSFFSTMMLYGFMGPAAGSEALKLSVCLLAGLVTAIYARQTFLARKVLPGVFSVRAFFATLGEISSGTEPPSALRVVHVSLFRAYLGLILLGLATVSMAALGFSDFGGTLVSGVVFSALIFILFGFRLTLVFGLLALVASFFALLTDKVQGRIQLMLEPMTASVSDFARLIKFSEAAQPLGYGIGQIRWCSFEGACLPIQALSDYFPVLLAGTVGATGGLMVLLLLVFTYIGLMARAVRGVAAGQGAIAAVYASSFFLLLATLAQTIITFMGNWRLIPLTGLGLPLMSMGWSSVVAICMGFGLLLVAVLRSRAVAHSLS